MLVEKVKTVKVLVCDFCEEEIGSGIGISCRGCHKGVCSEHKHSYDGLIYCPECIKHVPEIRRKYEGKGNYLFCLPNVLVEIKKEEA